MPLIGILAPRKEKQIVFQRMLWRLPRAVCGEKKSKLFFIVSRALKELRTEILRSAVLNEKFCLRKPVSKILKQLRGDELIFHNGTEQYFRNSF